MSRNPFIVMYPVITLVCSYYTRFTVTLPVNHFKTSEFMSNRYLYFLRLPTSHLQSLLLDVPTTYLIEYKTSYIDHLYNLFINLVGIFMILITQIGCLCIFYDKIERINYFNTYVMVIIAKF